MRERERDMVKEWETDWLSYKSTNNTHILTHTQSRQSFAETNTIFYFISHWNRGERMRVLVVSVKRIAKLYNQIISRRQYNKFSSESEIVIKITFTLTVDHPQKSVRFANTIWWKVGAYASDIDSLTLLDTNRDRLAIARSTFEDDNHETLVRNMTCICV